MAVGETTTNFMKTTKKQMDQSFWLAIAIFAVLAIIGPFLHCR